MIFFNVVFLVIGFIAIVMGGDMLIKASIKISKETGIPEIIMGATVVSIVTTLPELMVTLYSCVGDMPGIAIGNAIGSMVFNLSLIVGLCMLFVPQFLDSKLLTRNISILFISTTLFFFFVIDGDFISWQGIVLSSLFVVHFILSIFAAKKKVAVQRIKIAEKKTVAISKREMLKLVGLFIFAAATVSVGADLLVSSAESIAKSFNISDHIIGVTVIAIGTSLPDLSTAISSIRMKRTALAIGNTIGANIINSTLLVGISSLFQDGPIDINKNIIFFALPLLILSMLVIYIPVAIKKKTSRWQGVVLIIITIIYYLSLFLKFV